MPRKIRQFIKDLENAGFVNRGGKGSHRNFLHEKGVAVTVSGKLGDDAKPYQEKIVKQKIDGFVKSPISLLRCISRHVTYG
ncbi:MAG: type II toxin-antitoxin system HicA family toxin [Thermodesulfobacteriota bacterium]|nr:type II toxin-antitoxin system HicA family toxin [Thermodesulfobacteriota bacterium]